MLALLVRSFSTCSSPWAISQSVVRSRETLVPVHYFSADATWMPARHRKHNNRKLSDAERADELLRGAKGKRLLYQQPREAANT